MTWRPAPRFSDSEPVSVMSSLESVTRRLGPGAGSQLAVFARWAELVGPQVADHARPVAVRAGVLVIEVENPSWATQLRYLRSQLLQRLVAGGVEGVAEVEIRVAGSGGDPRPPRSAPGVRGVRSGGARRGPQRG